MMKTVGVIGLGPQGQRIAKAITASTDFSIAWVCDTSRSVLKEASERYDAPGIPALDEAGSCDVVFIATNGPSHEPITLQLLEAGFRRIIVEKPMATSVSACARMRAAADAVGAQLAVNQSRRVHPFYEEIFRCVEGGAWGELRSVYIQRPGIGLGCLGTHYFDFICYLGNSSAARVSARVDPFIGPNPRGDHFVDPGGLVVLELESGARGIVDQIEDGAGPMSVEIHLTNARLRIEERFASSELIVRDRSIKPGPGVPVKYEQRSISELGTPKLNPADVVIELLNDIVSEAPLRCEAVHGQHSIEILAAAFASHDDAGRPVDISKLTGAQRDRNFSIT